MYGWLRRHVHPLVTLDYDSPVWRRDTSLLPTIIVFPRVMTEFDQRSRTIMARVERTGLEASPMTLYSD